MLLLAEYWGGAARTNSDNTSRISSLTRSTKSTKTKVTVAAVPAQVQKKVNAGTATVGSDHTAFTMNARKHGLENKLQTTIQG